MNSEKPAYVTFDGPISAATGRRLFQVCARLATQKGHTEIHLLLATTGGSVHAGVVCHTALRALPAKIITYNTGSVGSIGNVVFLAGEERYAPEYSVFSFHGCNASPGDNVPEARLDEILESVRRDNQRIAEIIRGRTRLTAVEVSAFFLHEVIKSAVEAKECGIIDDIRMPMIPAGEQIIDVEVD